MRRLLRRSAVRLGAMQRRVVRFAVGRPWPATQHLVPTQAMGGRRRCKPGAVGGV